MMVVLREFRSPPVPTKSGFTVDLKEAETDEPVLNMHDIQADLLLGHEKEEEAIIFFKINNVSLFTKFLIGLPITSAAAVFRPDRDEPKAQLTGQAPPNPRFSVAFSMSGLSSLGRDPGKAPLLKPLADKLSSRAVEKLHDDNPGRWVVGKDGDDIDGVLIITGAKQGDVTGLLKSTLSDAAAAAAGYTRVYVLEGKTRPGGAAGHEHFNFLDGVSQPGIRGWTDAGKTIPLTMRQNPKDPNQGLPGQDLLWPGEFVLGYATQVAGDDFTEMGPPDPLPAAWMKDGAFLVVRRLKQFVPEMHAGIAAAAVKQGMDPALLEAQIVGRWPNGAPILLSDHDDPDLGTKPEKNNDFEFGEDRKGLVCPWAGHIRKAYPRDDVRHDIDPDEEGGEVDKAEAFTQTHRMLRRGIPFGDEVQPEEQNQGKTIHDRGLIFKCYVTNLEEQFEFVQNAWCNDPDFVQPASGHDSIIGQVAGGGDRTFAGVGEPGAKPTFSFAPWVRMTGGGYFFAPSLDFINGLGAEVA